MRALAVPCIVAALAAAPHATSATFVVNSMADEADFLPGDGTCATAGGTCTLRAAIQEANALAGADDVSVPAGTYVLSLAGRGEDACATGDLDVTEAISITGAGAGSTVIDGAGIDRIVEVLLGAPTDLAGFTLTRGDALTQDGGAVNALSALGARDCIFSQNHAQHGGAVRQQNGALDQCIFEDNRADMAGGALIIHGDTTIDATRLSRNEGDVAGAIWLARGAACVVSGSVFEQNVARTGPGGAVFGDWGVLSCDDTSFRGNRALEGGAIATALDSLFELRLHRVTIADNVAMQAGGAIFASGEEVSTTLIDSTISGNSSPSVLAEYSAITSLNSTIAADQVAFDLHLSSSVELGRSIVIGSMRCDGSTAIATLGDNILPTPLGCPIIGDTSTDLLDVDPLLGPLQANGGPTFTRALLRGSPAIDAAADRCLDETGALLLVDQRGVLRPMDGDDDGSSDCDIGAFEAPGCGADSDGDTLGDGCDCAPADPGSRSVPSEADLRVAHDAPTSDALVSWQDLAVDAGDATLYDVASASLGELWTVRVADAPCVATALANASWRDTRPVIDAGWYYLARGVNACGPATSQGWGRDSLGAERPACP